MSAPSDPLFSSPDLFPLHLDAGLRRLYFVPMSRATYGLSAFLDERIVRLPQPGYDASLDELLARADAISTGRRPVHYVLHGAFSCSTLLARALDLLPHTLVLREPALLTQVAGQRLQMGATGMEAGPEAAEWQRLLDLCMRLLSRTYARDDTVLIKANDWCNILGHTLLRRDPRSRALFLSHPLREFVLSCIKWPQRREWLRTRMSVPRAADPRLAGIDAGALRDAELAALLWLAYNSICRELCRAYPERVLSVDGREVACLSPAALSAAFAFLGFPLDEPQLQRILLDPSLRRHAKEFSLSYDAEARRADLAAVNAQYGAEADDGIAWAQRVRDELGLEPVFPME